ncbi:hypothetical protein ACFE04_015240 [Oxalis oulophora]
MDPLTVLREYTMRGELDKIVTVHNEFRFGNDYIFPCSIQTSFLRNKEKGKYYSLESLIFLLKNLNIPHNLYVQIANEKRIQVVTLPDRKPLLDYLTGKTAHNPTSTSLQQSTAITGLDVNIAYNVYDESTGIDINANAYDDDATNINNSSILDHHHHHQSMDVVDVEMDKDKNQDEEKLRFIDMIKAVERPLKDRETMLECGKNKDFYGVLTAATKREEEKQLRVVEVRKDGLVATNKLTGGDEVSTAAGGGGGYDGAKPKMHLMKGSKIGEGVPIILVPSATQTLVTIYNVKEFLEDGVFIPTDVKMKQMASRPDCVTVRKNCSRDRDKVMTAYEVRDKPSALKPEDWDRVVAVFVLGKEWQFKDWPFKDHVEIFNRIIGFFIRFEDDSIESAKTVKQWNVKIISISKNKRHQDRTAALEVWEKLEQFVRSRSHS